MRIFAVTVPALLALTSVIADAPGQSPRTLKARALESHDGMTILAQPWPDSALYKRAFGKRSPFAVGIVAVQVTLRNALGENVRVNLDRVLLLATFPDGTKLELSPMNSEDVADAVQNPGTRRLATRKKRIVAKPAGWRDKHWWEVKKRVELAGLSSDLVPPHSTLRGLLYFDVQGQLSLLNSAHLYVPDLFATGRHQPVMYFELDLSSPIGPGD